VADRPRFKVDENLPDDAARILGQAGYDAVTIGTQNLNSASDARLADVGQGEGRTLVTLDLDFADIRAYPPERIRASSSFGSGARTSAMSAG
jgi:predicted nuclease of predicted toxin-antitoxin system